MKRQATQQEAPERVPYESPSIIYEGEITTRAGSPTGGTDSLPGVDPSELFGKSE